MKLVINKCYGGFGLSPEAVLELYKSKCPHIEEFPPGDWHISEAEGKDLEKTKKAVGFYAGITAIKKKNKIVILHDNHGQDSRNCEFLVQVVNKLGTEKASHSLAKLKIIEIPDDVKYEISDYDGIESIHEVHRYW